MAKFAKTLLIFAAVVSTLVSAVETVGNDTDNPVACSTNKEMQCAPSTEENIETGTHVTRETARRTNICLNMIVKNEVRVLPRLFRSVKDYIDYYVIVDTGSTDETIELIKDEMAKYGINGEVHERPWVNFGVNRQQALELAVEAKKADWLLFIDADEELGVANPMFYETLEPGTSYRVEKHHSGMRYAVTHLIDIRHTQWKWEGPVHNYLTHIAGSKKKELLKDIWIIYHPGEGAKSQGVTTEQKYLRDAKILEEYLVEHPNDARSQFYLGQSYKDADHLEKAYEAYKKRVAMGGWEEEAFYAQFQVGQLASRLKEPEEVVLKEFLAAYEMRPSRVEPLHGLSRYFRSKKSYGKAYVFASAGANMTRPADDILFVQQELYDWRMLDELCVVAYHAGHFLDGRSACETILHRVHEGLHVPETHLTRIKENLEWNLIEMKKRN